ncbi:MAG: four helix bundle protein [Chitinophagales bacterium]|nr:four helix bundle protein [Chitinophagales bacterium]
MFLKLNHKNLDAYKVSRQLLKESYKVTAKLPVEEKYNLTQQIRRAALSVKLNIAEGASRKSEAERKRYYEISRGSVIEIDAAIEAAVDLELLSEDQLTELGKSVNSAFALLSRMINP